MFITSRISFELKKGVSPHGKAAIKIMTLPFASGGRWLNISASTTTSGNSIG